MKINLDILICRPSTVVDIDIFCSSAFVIPSCSRPFFFEAMSKDSAAEQPWATAPSFQAVPPLASHGGMVPSAPPQEAMPANAPPPKRVVSTPPPQGMASTPPPKGMASSFVEGEVLEVSVDNKRFKVIAPNVPYLPGGQTNPYPTSDIRRSMAQPSCSMVNVGGEDMCVLYGYFWNNEKNQKNWTSGEGVPKSEQPPGNKYVSLRASPAECLDRSTWGSFD